MACSPPPRRPTCIATGWPPPRRADRFWTVLTADAEPVGVVGLWSTPWAGGAIDEVGWMLVPAVHGRGHGRWAANAVVRQARADDRYAEIHAFPAAVNAASNAICRALGFRRLSDADLDYAGRPLRYAHWVLDVSG